MADESPDPSAPRTAEEFADQLRLLKVWAGNPSLRQLERLSGLPRSTIADALSPKRRNLPSLDVVRRFVRACGVSETMTAQVETAWRRLQANVVSRPETGSASFVPRQLPADVSGFAGRRSDLKELDALMAGNDSPPPGIAVICGTAGGGKTTLAVHWAHQVAEEFPDGQLYVNLRGYSSGPATTPEQALALLLRALGVPGEEMAVERDALAGMYRSLTSGKRVLVLLDNATDAAQVRPLVPGGTSCLTLITSRDRLTGLVAREGARRLALDVLTPAEAQVLLIRVLGPERVLREERAAAQLSLLCSHLPLALRIAAANLADRPQQMIVGYAAELAGGNRLGALAVAGDEEAAVRAAFDLSYAALDPRARMLFRRLGLAPGPELTSAAAEALADATGAEADRLLQTLAGAHLIEPAAPGRYTVHDLLRLYASERALLEDDDSARAAAVRRLFGWHLHTAIAAAEVIRPDFLRLPAPRHEAGVPPLSFADGAAALEWLDHEHANLVALVGAAAAAGHQPVAWQLTDALRGYYWLRRHTVEWLTAAHAGLAAAESDHDLPAGAAMHQSLGTAHWSVGDHHLAAEHFRQAVELSRAAGDRPREFSNLGNLGGIYSELGALDDAADCYARELAFFRELGDTGREARALGNLGLTQLRVGRLAEAAGHLEAAVAIRRAAGELASAANALGTLGVVYRHLGRFDGAAECLEQARQLNHTLEDRFSEAAALDDLARLHRDAGRSEQALDCVRQALALVREGGTSRIELDLHITSAAVRRSPDELAGVVRTAQEIGYRHGEADALAELAESCRVTGESPEALAHARRALELARGTGQRLLEGQALNAIARIHGAGGEHDKAIEVCQQAMDVHRHTGHRLGLARAMITLGLATAAGGGDARPHWRDALGILGELDVPEAREATTLLGESVRDRPNSL